MTTKKEPVKLSSVKQKPQPNQCCIDMLEQLLEEAKAGNVIGIAFVCLQERCKTETAMGISQIMHENPVLTVGLIEALKVTMINHMMS